MTKLNNTYPFFFRIDKGEFLKEEDTEEGDFVDL